MFFNWGNTNEWRPRKYSHMGKQTQQFCNLSCKVFCCVCAAMSISTYFNYFLVQHNSVTTFFSPCGLYWGCCWEWSLPNLCPWMVKITTTFSLLSTVTPDLVTILESGRRIETQNKQFILGYPLPICCNNSRPTNSCLSLHRNGVWMAFKKKTSFFHLRGYNLTF